MTETIRSVVSEEVREQFYNKPERRKEMEEYLKKMAYGRLKNITDKFEDVEYDISWERGMGMMECVVIAEARVK